MLQDFERRKWAERVHQWQESKMTAKAWCRKNKIVYNTFLGWRKRLNLSIETNISHKKQSDANFIELLDQLKTPSSILLEYDGIRIYLLDNFDAYTLKRCLNVLRGDSC